MSAHTPGPWAVTSRYGELKDEVAAPGRAVATVWTRKSVTKVRADDSQRTSEVVADAEGEANARLIAAAPELHGVASLARVLAMRVRQGGTISAEDIRQADIALHAADAAIRKVGAR